MLCSVMAANKGAPSRSPRTDDWSEPALETPNACRNNRRSVLMCVPRPILNKNSAKKVGQSEANGPAKSVAK